MYFITSYWRIAVTIHTNASISGDVRAVSVDFLSRY
jgi:hypothetical protein